MENKTETKTYKVLDENGLYEYNLIMIKDGDNTTFSLYTNEGEQWSNHNKNALQLSMIDNGNCILFSKKLKYADYSDLLHLRILLNFSQEMEMNLLNRAKYQVVLSEVILKV